MNKQREDKTNYTSWNIRECEEFIKEINRKYFDGDLLFKVVPHNGIKRHVTLNQDIINYDEGLYYRIEVNEPEFYPSSKAMIIDIVTQMVLAYGVHHKVKLTSRAGAYKNKRFKEAAEKVGLLTTKTENGAEPIDVNDDIIRIYNKYDFKTMNIYVLSDGISKGNKQGIKIKKTNSRKYICPSCGDSFRATKEVFFMCKKCKVDAVLANE